MFLVYKPEGGEEQRWPFNPKKLRAAEAEQIEKVTGWDFAEFGQHLQKGSILALRALLWTFQRRTHEVLKFRDVDFAVGEVDLLFDRDEVAEARKVAEDLPPGPERDLALAQIDAMAKVAPEPEGKAPASSGG